MYRIYSPISRDPKLLAQNTDPMLTKKVQETLGYKPRPKTWNETQKITRKFPRNLQIQVEVNNKHDRSADL